MTVQPTRDQLRALANAATPGPWETRGYKEMPGKYVVGPRKPGDLARGPVVLMEPLFCDERSAADAEFIVAARTALPRLLNQLDQAEAELDSWMTRAYEAEKREHRATARIAEEKRLRMKATAAATEAEHRIARLEAQTSIRGRAVVMYRERAREADQQLDHWMGRAYEAEARMIQAEARIKATLSVAQEWETKEVWPEIAPIMRAASARIRRALDT